MLGWWSLSVRCGLFLGLWAMTSEWLLSALSGWSYESCFSVLQYSCSYMGFPDSFSAPHSGYLWNTQKHAVGISWPLISLKMNMSKKYEHFWPKPNASSMKEKRPRQINMTTHVTICSFVLVFLFCSFHFNLVEFKMYSNYAVPFLCLCHRAINAYNKQLLTSLWYKFWIHTYVTADIAILINMEP